MEEIKGFAVFKNTEKKHDKMPDYTASVKIGDKYYEFAGGWVKDGTKGKFMLFTLAEERSYEWEGVTVHKPGFKIDVIGLKSATVKPTPVKYEIEPSDIPF